MSVVTVEAQKLHMNVVDDHDDAVIADLIDAAEAWVDRWLPEPMAQMTEVPADLKHAVKMLAAHLYENREATLVGITAEDLPLGVWDIINQHRAWAF
jgi:hypothetical protein